MSLVSCWVEVREFLNRDLGLEMGFGFSFRFYKFKELFDLFLYFCGIFE